jgi:hypothetical protein
VLLCVPLNLIAGDGVGDMGTDLLRDGVGGTPVEEPGCGKLGSGSGCFRMGRNGAPASSTGKELETRAWQLPRPSILSALGTNQFERSSWASPVRGRDALEVVPGVKVGCRPFPGDWTYLVPC